MRLLTAVGVAALIVAFCVPAFAETQSVKISGDIGVTHVRQENLDLADDKDTTVTGSTAHGDNFFMQTVGLNVDADLTDNVATFVRVISQRDWDDGSAGDWNLNLDEAYITLKEFLYAPLTVKIGRQDLWFGKGLIVGNNALAWDVDGTIGADELSELTAFDAIRGTLDYDPWTIDLVYAKIDDPNIGTNDDRDLYGVNVGYLFDRYEAEAEAYYWLKYDQSTKPTQDSQKTHVIGLRGSFVPYENMNVWAESAYQGGKYQDSGVSKSTRDAWAFDLGVDYTWVEQKWTPKAGLEYQFLSGDNYQDGGDYEGWDPMYKGKFDSLIYEFSDVIYTTDYAGTVANLRNRLDGNTNQHQLKGVVVIEPIADLTLNAELSYFLLDEEILSEKTDDDIGTELDGGLTYDYTEDVSFIVKGGVFWPGDVYTEDMKDRANKIISAVTVEF